MEQRPGGRPAPAVTLEMRGHQRIAWSDGRAVTDRARYTVLEMMNRNERLTCRDCRRPIAEGMLVYVANLWPSRWGDQSHVHCGPCVERAGPASPA